MVSLLLQLSSAALASLFYWTGVSVPKAVAVVGAVAAAGKKSAIMAHRLKRKKAADMKILRWQLTTPC